MTKAEEDRIVNRILTRIGLYKGTSARPKKPSKKKQILTAQLTKTKSIPS